MALGPNVLNGLGPNLFFLSGLRPNSFVSNNLWPNHSCQTAFSPIISIKRLLAQSFISHSLWPNHSCQTVFGPIISIKRPLTQLFLSNGYPIQFNNSAELIHKWVFWSSILQYFLIKILLTVLCWWICPCTWPYTFHNISGYKQFNLLLIYLFPLGLFLILLGPL